MKKLLIAIAILTGMSLNASAQFYTGAIYQRESYGDQSQSLGDYLEQRFRESGLYNFYENSMLYQYEGFLNQDLLNESSAYESSLFQNNYPGGGAMQRGKSTLFSDRNGGNIYGTLNLPNMHGLDGDQDTPIGSGIAVLAALGGAYLLRKKRKE